MKNSILVQQLNREIERVISIDQSPKKAGAEPLLVSILYILKQFSGTTNATFSVEMRRDYCMPVKVIEKKPLLSVEFPEIYDELAEKT